MKNWEQMQFSPIFIQSFHCWLVHSHLGCFSYSPVYQRLQHHSVLYFHPPTLDLRAVYLFLSSVHILLFCAFLSISVHFFPPPSSRPHLPLFTCGNRFPLSYPSPPHLKSLTQNCNSFLKLEDKEYCYCREG